MDTALEKIAKTVVRMLATMLGITEDEARRQLVAELLRQMRPPGCAHCGARLPG